MNIHTCCRFLLAFFFLMKVSLFGAISISLTGNPGTLSVTTAIAGSNPTSATNNSTRYSLSSDLKTRKITGKINTNMPSGLTLSVQLAAPSGAVSSGSVAMTTTAADLVTSINANTIASNLTVTYTLQATATAAKVTNATKTLTLTIQ